LLIAGVLLGGGLAIAAMLRPQPIEVEVARVVREPLEVSLQEQGETRIEPRFTIAAPVAGRLLRPTLREGDAVRAGAPVAVLLPAPLDPRATEQARAALQTALAGEEEARARVAEDTAAHRQTQRTRERQEQLAAAGQLAREELDRARTAERTAREALDAARHRAEAAAGQVATARAMLESSRPGEDEDRRIVLTAPADGRVLRLFEASERVVTAGAPLLEVGDPSRLEVVVDVLSTDAVALGAGVPMLADVGAGRELRAELRYVEPAAFTKTSPLGVEEQRVRVVGEVLDSAEGVGDRYRVEARIELWQGEQVLQVPTGAVFRRGSGWATFLALDGRARLRQLRVGHRNADGVEILDGLREGDRVVVYPPESLTDGARISSIEG